MLPSMAAPGLSHSRQWHGHTPLHSHTLITHTCSLALLAHTHNTHAHNYNPTQPYAHICIRPHTLSTQSRDPADQPAHPEPTLTCGPLSSLLPHFKIMGSLELDRPPWTASICQDWETLAPWTQAGWHPCLGGEMPTGLLWGWEDGKGFLQHLNGIYSTRLRGMCAHPALIILAGPCS